MHKVGVCSFESIERNGFAGLKDKSTILKATVYRRQFQSVTKVKLFLCPSKKKKIMLGKNIK